jgi:hypothetical protein
MCEHCSEAKFQIEGLAADRVGEELCEVCGEFTATEVWYERRVESHLCAKAMNRENALLDAGLGDFLRATGLQTEVDYVPIDGEQPCDFPEGNPLIGQEPMPCSRAAKFAKMVVEEYHYCDDHAD